MEIITGRTGTDHVYAADDAELYRMFIGSGDHVFRTGNQFNATMFGAYTIRVSDGSLMTQGRLAKIRPTDGYDELQFDVGVTGYKRADLVVAEYRKTVTTHEEEVEREGETTIIEVTDEFEDISLIVLKGANNTGTYITPTYATGNIDNGEVHQIPLWEVRFNGVNFESLIDRRIFLDGVPYDTLIAHAQAVYAQANARVDDALEQVESGMNGLKTFFDSELIKIKEKVTVISNALPEEIFIQKDVSTDETGALPFNETLSEGITTVYINGLRHFYWQIENGSTVKKMISQKPTTVPLGDFVVVHGDIKIFNGGTGQQINDGWYYSSSDNSIYITEDFPYERGEGTLPNVLQIIVVSEGKLYLYDAEQNPLSNANYDEVVCSVVPLISSESE